MRIITTAIMTAIVIGGCASVRDTMVYEKPGVSEEQKRADEAVCTLAALDTAGQHGAAILYVDRDTVTDCMRARGYQVLTGG
ncbi:MAG TPA: hypothetical protein VKD28_15360 [Gemmatimonadales bacterium]|nr:hypothetical protein [Gemmatimonadales bacterium]